MSDYGGGDDEPMDYGVGEYVLTCMSFSSNAV